MTHLLHLVCLFVWPPGGVVEQHVMAKEESHTGIALGRRLHENTSCMCFVSAGLLLHLYYSYFHGLTHQTVCFMPHLSS